MYARLIATGLVVGLAAPVSATTFTDRFTSYYAFGDSLTDDGKFGVLFPPSLGGRFSDGPTYAELVADTFDAAGRDTGNLALGGATAGDVNLRPLGPLGTFEGQIDAFESSLTFNVGLPTDPAFITREPEAPAPGENPLVSVLFGGNDFFQSDTLSDDPDTILAAMVAAADAVADGIRDIAAIGGQAFDDFLVMTLPDIGGTPAYTGDAAAFATLATQTYNDQLSDNVRDLRDEGLNVYGFNTDAATQPLLDDIENGGPIFGVLDALTPCTLSLSEPGPACDNPEQLFFTDVVHPNSVAHQVIGAAVETRLAAIPLPASLPLALGGLGLLGWIARRRAA